MAPIAAFVPVQVQMAVWQIVLGDRRKPTSGGPRDRARHLAYQRAYQAARRLHGVRTIDGVAHYADRRKADRVRRVLRSLASFGVAATFRLADMAAAGMGAVEIQASFLALAKAS